MVNVKLNENYHQDFITLQNGAVFYKEKNYLKKPGNIVDVNPNDWETQQMIAQKILVFANPPEPVVISETMKPTPAPKMENVVVDKVKPSKGGIQSSEKSD